MILTTAPLPTIHPGSKEEMITMIKLFTGGSLVDMINSHNTQSVIFIYRQQSTMLLMKAEFGNQTATHREIAWYTELQARGADVGVRILNTVSAGTHALLLMEYIDAAWTIDEIVLEVARDNQHSALASKVSQQLIAALEVDKMLHAFKPSKVSKKTVDSFFMKRHAERRTEVRQVPYLEQLFSKQEVAINGKSYLTPDHALAKLQAQRSFYEHLTPDSVGMIHGDLHCGNILTTSTGIHLVDPNGQLAMPIEYDVGKLLHSIHGNYGSIMRGRYTLEDRGPDGYDFTINSPVVYDEVLDDIRRYLGEDAYLRGLYAEALHFTALLPHHASNQDETTALLLRSVQLWDIITSLA